MSNASLASSVLSGLTLGQLVLLFNEGAEVYRVEGFNPVKKFASKDAAIARIEKLLSAVDGRADLQLGPGAEEGSSTVKWVDVDPHAASNALIGAAVAAGDLDLPEVTEVEIVEEEGPEADASEEVEEVPFVKLSKEELAALGERGTPAREAYRKARRAAARAARKAKEEAASA